MHRYKTLYPLNGRNFAFFSVFSNGLDEFFKISSQLFEIVFHENNDVEVSSLSFTIIFFSMEENYLLLPLCMFELRLK
jgi:hypothetical protein